MENKRDAAQNDSLFGQIQNRLDTRIARHYQIIFLISFALILLIHLYMFTNLFINHDNIRLMFSNGSGGLPLGRWLKDWARSLTGGFSSPWLNGIVGALFLAAACTLFAAIFDIRRPLPACLLILCMVAFPTVTSIYTYMQDAVANFLSMLLAVLAAWLIRRGGVAAGLLGVLCISCSMGIYQAFFCLTAATLVLTMMVEVCEGRWKDSFKSFFATGLRYLSWLALGMALYFLVTRICLWHTGTKLSDYQGISSMGQITPAILLQRVKKAYLCLKSYYFNNHMYFLNWFPILVKVSLLADAVTVGFLFWTRGLHKSIDSFLQLAVLLDIFPLACNSIYLMTDAWTVHNLMIYPAVLPLLLPVLLGNRITVQDITALGELGKGYLRTLGTLCACGLLVIQAAFGYLFLVTTNRAYTCMELTYQGSYAYFTRLTAKIELQPGYTPDTPVAFLGKASQPTSIPSSYMTGVNSLEQTINMYSRGDFLSYFMSSSYHNASSEETEAVKASLEFQQMPYYPAEGSIATINGVIVVKLGE